jgi:hypothetical protein
MHYLSRMKTNEFTLSKSTLYLKVKIYFVSDCGKCKIDPTNTIRKKFPCFVALTSFKNEEIEYPMQVKQSINHHFCTLTIWEILKCFEHFVELNNLKTSVRWRYHDIMMGMTYLLDANHQISMKNTG